MSADKKTLLRDALKFVQQGKIDKAIEAYRATVKLDPKDVKIHNALGDLLIRQGKKKDAIACYLEVSDLYEKDGFALRAIAICQKILNLDAELVAVRLKIADLYAAQKLPAEARTQYLQVADHYDKKGEVAAALDVFRKIADLEPDNLVVRVKLAGRFEKQKFAEKAAEEYVRAAKGYLEKKDAQASVQLYVRAFRLHPGNIKARRGLADYHAQRQDWKVLVGLLQPLAAKGSQEIDLLVLYGEALTQVNHAREAAEVLEKVRERDPNNLSLNLALGRAHLKNRELEKGVAALNRCVSAYLAESKYEAVEALLREMAQSAPDDEKIQLRILEVAQQRGDRSAEAQSYLTLAGLHERKGLLRNAAGALEKYLEIQPGDAVAVERLEELRRKAPAPKAAPPPPSPPEPPVAAVPPPPPITDEDVVEIDLEGEDLTLVGVEGEEEEELDLELEGEVEAPAPPATVTTLDDVAACLASGAPERAAVFLQGYLRESPDDLEAVKLLCETRRAQGDRAVLRDAFVRLAELHRRARRFDDARAAYRHALDADPRSAKAALAMAEIVVEEEQMAQAAAAPPAAEKAEVAEVPEVEAAPEVAEVAEVEEAPEVAEEPGEAGEEIVLDLLEPAREEEPVAAAAPPLAEAETPAEVEEHDHPVAVGEPPEVRDEVSFEGFSEGEFAEFLPEPPTPPEPEVVDVPTPEPSGTADFDAFLAEASFYFQQGLLDEAEFLYNKLLKLAPEHPEVVGQLRRLEEARSAAAAASAEEQGAVPAATSPPSEPPPSGDKDFADFMSELRQEIETEDALVPALPQEEAGLDDIFQEFQRSVKEQLGEEDYETHYNLGIAYKEMGLLPEAISEFSLAERSPVRGTNSLSMIALCLREMGRFDEAAQKLRTGINLVTEGGEEHKGFLYDLALLQEIAGRQSESQDALRILHAIDPGYRDIASRLRPAAPEPAAPASTAPAPPPRKKPKVSYL